MRTKHDEYFGDRPEKLSAATKATPEGFVFHFDRHHGRRWHWKQVVDVEAAKAAGFDVIRGGFMSRKHALADVDAELRRRAEILQSASAQSDHVVPLKL